MGKVIQDVNIGAQRGLRASLPGLDAGVWHGATCGLVADERNLLSEGGGGHGQPERAERPSGYAAAGGAS